MKPYGPNSLVATWSREVPKCIAMSSRMDACQGTEAQRRVGGHRDMVLAHILGRQPNVAASLPRDFVAECPQRLCEILAG